MNLIGDDWIATNLGPLKPSQALVQASSVGWGRGDWDAATQAMLIGLLQTAILFDSEVCPDETAWRVLFRDPPTPEVIGLWFEPFIQYFDGRVFEDFDELEGANEVPIANLLPETPGANAYKKCSDIARWGQSTEQHLTEAEVRIALL